MKKMIILFAYLFMVTMNILANTIPLNGINTGQVSDLYENLFAPAGYTFSIWGLIYFLLFLYVIDHFLDKDYKEKANTGIYFIISSMANGLWIITWHYELIELSLIVMVVILLSLIKIQREIDKTPPAAHKIFQRKIPFSVYFGWITVATIANVTVLLVSLGFKNPVLNEVSWLNMILVIGTIISGLTLWKYKDVYYGLVILWAYIGILSKHISEEGFSAMYPSAIVTLIICLVLMTGEIAYIISHNQKKKPSTLKT